ncbi:aminotransferase class I/II-fold pyridoxal phosphate-dependent enzyme [Gulosibacter sp. ACHW.36C]|uniref:PLP-dependent transferase n=1 Tax=Gulosibacter sediminis TaxID=1729695 RepID=A0ABY4MVU1_9MICO|nr:PLP-dependent transferase [Gulosibacter sediminis]UQN14164.1 PLP-dependent transferase [Gulosibacter sediminis]
MSISELARPTHRDIDATMATPAAPSAAQSTTPYADALEQHARSVSTQLMVPGHGGTAAGVSGRLADFFGERLLQLDIPMLVDDVDLGDNSPYDQALALAAEAWGARRTWFLTNGASQANRTVALALRGLGEGIVMQRSVHSSFIDGMLVADLVPTYVMPSIDHEHGVAHGITLASLAEALERADASGVPLAAVYVVSPSYFGAAADLAALAELAHAHGVPFIVDGAWGPHFGFHDGLPASPIELGADLVISSTHKLAGSLTQSAMLHLADGPFADVLEAQINRAMSMTASTSSSALLRASLDIARHALVNGREQIGASIEAANAFRDVVRADGRIGVLSDTFGRFDDIVDVDPLHIVLDVSVAGLSGHWVRQQLINRHALFFEMSTATSIVAIVGAGKVPDYAAVFDALIEVITSPEAALVRGETKVAFPTLPEPGVLRRTARRAYFADSELVDASAAIGRVSADTLAAYPPGIPNVIPGEEITAETVAFLQAVAASPTGHVRGAIDPTVQRMRVLRDR